MNMEELGYILYMENEDLKSKSYEDITESEKVNLKLNPFLDGELTTKDEELKEKENTPINIPPTI